MLNGPTSGIVCFTVKFSLRLSRDEALDQVARCRQSESKSDGRHLKLTLQFFRLMSLLKLPLVVGVRIYGYEGPVARAQSFKSHCKIFTFDHVNSTCSAFFMHYQCYLFLLSAIFNTPTFLYHLRPMHVMQYHHASSLFTSKIALQNR